MNYTFSIKQICHDRGIKILVHFTHIENLRRILEEGLLSRETLETIRDPLKKPPRFNDQDRYDNHREAICLSIEQILKNDENKGNYILDNSEGLLYCYCSTTLLKQQTALLRSYHE